VFRRLPGKDEEGQTDLFPNGVKSSMDGVVLFP
jgi:hypothetical protein